MSTAPQIAANRANSQHSTGAKTEQGKAESCLNNFRHGLAGAFTVLPWEDQAAYEALRLDLKTEHQPATPTEALLINAMAQHHWLAQRALTLQETCFNSEIPLCDDDPKLALYIRYQTTHERAFHKCLNDLLRLRAEKRKQGIGFESQRTKAAEEIRRQGCTRRASAPSTRAPMSAKSTTTFAKPSKRRFPATSACPSTP